MKERREINRLMPIPVAIPRRTAFFPIDRPVSASGEDDAASDGICRFGLRPRCFSPMFEIELILVEKSILLC